MSNSASDNAPKPRLCHVKKWSDFNGYGFNLHAEKGKAGQFIGKVDAGSPAESAGLREADRIIEVNGTNIGNENHSQVVQRIKTVPNETKLLVVDDVTDAYFKEKKIVVRGDMPYVETIICPDEKGGEVIRSTAGGDGDKSDSAAAASDGPSPRQCHLVIWPDFQGYGFNLHAEKGKPGQFIGKVDAGSPAEAAGLKQGDRIVEVNSQYIGDDNHSQVVQKIKADDKRTTMLVVDEEAENYYRQKGIRVSSSMPQTRNIYCPASKADYQNGTPAADPIAASPAPVAAAAASDKGPSPRLCHLKIWPDYQGYGFNLHAEKDKGKGQRVGKVDANSPAERAGLRDGDKIIEVNGQNMANEDHKSVVSGIKSDPTQVKLLVVDSAAFDYYTSRGQTISSSMSNVETIVCPDSQSAGLANGTTAAPVEAEETKAEVNHNQVNGAASSEEEVKQEETPQVDVNENEAAKPEEPEANGVSEGDAAVAAIDDSIREHEEEVKEEEEKKQKEEEDRKVEEEQKKNDELDELQDYEVVARQEPEPQSEPQSEPEPEPKPKDPEPEPEPTPAKEPEKPTPAAVVYDAPSEPVEAVYEDTEKGGERLYEEPTAAPVSPSSPPVVVGGIEFAGSAKEAREKLSKRSSRKHEVKKQDGVSMRDKYELFQKL